MGKHRPPAGRRRWRLAVITGLVVVGLLGVLGLTLAREVPTIQTAGQPPAPVPSPSQEPLVSPPLPAGVPPVNDDRARRYLQGLRDNGVDVTGYEQTAVNIADLVCRRPHLPDDELSASIKALSPVELTPEQARTFVACARSYCGERM